MATRFDNVTLWGLKQLPQQSTSAVCHSATETHTSTGPSVSWGEPPKAGIGWRDRDLRGRWGEVVKCQRSNQSLDWQCVTSRVRPIINNSPNHLLSLSLSLCLHGSYMPAWSHSPADRQLLSVIESTGNGIARCTDGIAISRRSCMINYRIHIVHVYIRGLTDIWDRPPVYSDERRIFRMCFCMEIVYCR